MSALPVDSGSLATHTTIVARIYYDDSRDLSRLTAYDVWEYNNVSERYVLAATDSSGLATLRSEGWLVALDGEQTARLAADTASGDFFDQYRTVDELYAALDTTEAAHPELTELITYGHSFCLEHGGCRTPGGDELAGFPLRAIRVTNEEVPGSSTIVGDVVAAGQKPIFFLMANIHAREITTPELAMRFLDLLLSDYGTNADITWLVDWHEVWIVPTANPDGHWLVELGEDPHYGGIPFMQRKNARIPNLLDDVDDCDFWPPSSDTQFGVDLNRNHSFGWGGLGASTEPCSPVFRGTAPASESEVAQLQTLISALVPDQRGPGLYDPAPDNTTGLLITLHSFSELILWPWGHLYASAPNMAGLRAIGDRLAMFNGYRSCQASAPDCLYASAGATDDWAYGELGIPAFTFEVGKEFMPPYQVIEAEQWPENRPALLYAAAIARAPYQLVHGPDVRGARVAGPGPLRLVSATIEATGDPAPAITAAVYTLDTPPWQSDATPVPMVAIDGTFDSSSERVMAELDTATLEPGRHLIYVRGQDSEGNWGPVSAAFLTIAGPLTESLYLPAIVN